MDHPTADACLIALAGGGGGVGRSTLAVELARSLARTAPNSVLLVDAAMRAPTLALRLGLATAPAPAPDAPLGERIATAGGLQVLTLTADEAEQADQTLVRLRSCGARRVIIDLPSPPEPWVLGFFVGSDLPVAVAAMELHSLYATARLLQLATARLLADAGAEVPPALHAPYAMLEPTGLTTRLEQAGLSARWEEAGHALSPWLLLNHTRESAERDLGPAVALALAHMVGAWPRTLGAVDHDDRRWFHMRQQHYGAPLTSDEGHSVQVAEIARQLEEHEAAAAAQLRAPRSRQHAAHEVLGMPVTATPLQMRTMYRRLWEGLRRDSALTRGLLPPPLRDHLLAELEETNRRLQMWLAEHREARPAEPARAASPAAQHPGAELARVRAERGMSRRELSLRTKIGLRVLDAIEGFDVDSLPRAVYLRGYLREIARTLELEGDAVLDTYLAAVAQARQPPVLTHARGRATRSGEEDE